MEFSWLWLGLGLLIGWSIEWIIDMRYWRGLGTRPPADNAFKADLSALRIRFDDAVEKLNTSEQEVEALRAQLREGIPTDTLALHDELAKAKHELALLRESKPDTSADNSLATELAEAKSMIERLQSENNTSPLIALNELQAKLDEAETELAGYRSVEEITRIEIKELRDKLAAAEAKGPAAKGKAADELAALRMQLAEKDAELDRLKSAPPVVKEAAGFDFESLRSKANQAEYFAKQLEAARATISTLELEMLNQQPAAGSPVSSAEVDELRMKNTELQTELLRLRTGYENATEEAELMRRRVADIELAERDTVSLADFNEIRARMEEAEARVAALTNDRQHGTEEMENLRKQLQDAGRREESSSELRNEIEELSAKLASRDQMVTEFRSEMNAMSAKLHTSLAELEDLRAARSARDSEAQNLREEISSMKEQLAAAQDLQKRLQTAEIELEAYNDLKAAKEQLQDRLGTMEGELIEARSMAGEIEILKAQLFQAQQANSEISQLRAHLEHHRTALAATLSQLDALTAPAPGPSAPTPPPIPRRDSFSEIEGIDLVAERKLWDAGLLTFADLADASAEQVGSLISPDEWMNVEAEAWIAEAKKRTNGG